MQEKPPIIINLKNHRLRLFRMRTAKTALMAAFSIILLSILLSGCLSLLSPRQSGVGANTTDAAPLRFGEVKTFKDGFAEMRRIDERYHTDFHTERLGTFVVHQADILPMEGDLFRFIDHVAGTSAIDFERLSHKMDKTELDLLLLFASARIEMLESERYFQEGYQYGDTGLVGDGFYCSERPIISRSIDAFNASVRHGLNATYYLDVVLTDLNSAPVTHRLIGIDDLQPEFYKAPFQTMAAQVRKNAALVSTNCANVTGEQDIYIAVGKQGNKQGSKKTR